MVFNKPNHIITHAENQGSPFLFLDREKGFKVPVFALGLRLPLETIPAIGPKRACLPAI